MTNEEQTFCMNLLQGRTKDNPLKRADIRALTGLHERKVRDMFSELRASGLPVINLGQGYYIASDPEDIRKYCAIVRAAALSQLNTTRSIDPKADEAARQLEFEDLEG